MCVCEVVGTETLLVVPVALIVCLWLSSDTEATLELSVPVFTAVPVNELETEPVAVTVCV